MEQKQKLLNKIKLTKHAISLEKDTNKLANLRNTLKIEEIRYQIELSKDRISLLRSQKR